MVDLGKHTGLSASLLSQLENEKVTPTLPTLAHIAMVFDIGLDYFFDNRRSKRAFAVTRANDQLRFPDRPDNPVHAYFFEVLAYSAKEKRVSAYVAEFPARTPEEVALSGGVGTRRRALPMPGDTVRRGRTLAGSGGQRTFRCPGTACAPRRFRSPGSGSGRDYASANVNSARPVANEQIQRRISGLQTHWG